MTNFFWKANSNFIQSEIDRESTYKASKASGGESSNHTISSSICLYCKIAETQITNQKLIVKIF